MSVPQSKRNESKFKAVYNATMIRNEVTCFLLRDFGVRPKYKNVRLDLMQKYKGISDEDMHTMYELMGKYGLTDALIDDYPQWLINEIRSKLYTMCSNLEMSVVRANAIFPTVQFEFDGKLNLIDNALVLCSCIIHELQYILHFFDIDANKYEPVINMLRNEIALIRGWKEKSKRVFKSVNAKNKKLEKDSNTEKSD